MAKLLQSLRDELVRRDYAAPPFAAAASSRARTAAIARFPSVPLLAALLPMDATEDRSLSCDASRLASRRADHEQGNLGRLSRRRWVCSWAFSTRFSSRRLNLLAILAVEPPDQSADGQVQRNHALSQCQSPAQFSDTTGTIAAQP